MKKITVLVGCLSATSLLYSLPVSNPSEASFLNQGVCWTSTTKTHNKTATSEKTLNNWGGSFGLRAGYYGDFVFNRHTKVEENVTETRLDNTAVYTNAGYLAINLYDYADLFGTLGMSNLFLSSDAATFGSSAIGQMLEIESNTHFSWSLGGRVSLFKYQDLTLGLEGQYFSTSPDIRRITQAATFSTYPTEFEMKYTEWQIGAGLSYRLRLPIDVIPYIAIDYSGVKTDMDNAQPGGTFDITLYDLKSQKHVGYALGVSFVDEDQVAVTIEGRFVNEKALYANAQLRF